MDRTMKTCPRCGEKSSGWFRLCGLCVQETNLLTEPKTPKRPIEEPEDK